VIDIQNFSDNESVGRELVMIKVKANSSNRSEVTQICDVFRGKIIDVAKESLVVEATGNGNKIVAFIELIEPFGIIELARTGTVSLRRGRADH
jgi:acetolactate synthase-1/3 small subunit